MLHSNFDLTDPFSADKCVRPQFEDYLSSVVQFENSMAKALQIQSESLMKVRDQVSPELLLEFNQKLENTIKLLLRKEMLLELLLAEFKDYCNREKLCSCKKCNQVEKVRKFKRAKACEDKYE